MNKDSMINYLRDVSKITKALADIGYETVLIGGMALVSLGSLRVTRDFDFMIKKPDDEGFKKIMTIFYDRGFELVSRLDKNGEVVGTIDNVRIAKLRIILDKPDSIYFFHLKSKLRVDLLLDFPLSFEELFSQAKKMKFVSQTLQVASVEHLLKLKKIACTHRNKAGDLQDLEFLNNLLTRSD